MTVFYTCTGRYESFDILLCSPNDLCAAENVGKILARRCLEGGIDRVFYDPIVELEHSEKV